MAASPKILPHFGRTSPVSCQISRSCDLTEQTDVRQTRGSRQPFVNSCHSALCLYCFIDDRRSYGTVWSNVSCRASVQLLFAVGRNRDPFTACTDPRTAASCCISISAVHQLDTRQKVHNWRSLYGSRSFPVVRLTPHNLMQHVRLRLHRVGEDVGGWV